MLFWKVPINMTYCSGQGLNRDFEQISKQCVAKGVDGGVIA